jgi:5'-3' exonuclease
VPFAPRREATRCGRCGPPGLGEGAGLLRVVEQEASLALPAAAEEAGAGSSLAALDGIHGSVGAAVSRPWLLVDASPYVFRSYFALPELTGPEGEPVQAVHGFATVLAKMLREERPQRVSVAFDESLTTSFRNEIFPAYKAHRTLPPPELEAQLGRCRCAADALGAETVADARYEADDLIATLLAREPPGAGERAIVVSSDKDLAQLVGPRVELYDYANGRRYDEAGVEARMGVSPARVADLLGLAGDPVDGIPGVPGIGAKTAAALLAACGDLEGVYRAVEEDAVLPVRGAARVARLLAEHRDVAFLSRRLATASTEAPLAGYRRRDPWPGPDGVALRTLCEEIGAATLAKRLLDGLRA